VKKEVKSGEAAKEWLEYVVNFAPYTYYSL